MLIQMAGHAGSGKSTLARQIARHVGGVVIDLDPVKSALLDAGADWDEASSWSYSVLYTLVEDALDASEVWVVVDTPSYWPQIHERLTAAADRSTAAYVFLECEADEEVRADRLARRRPSRSQVRGMVRRPRTHPRTWKHRISARSSAPPDAPGSAWPPIRRST